MKNRDRYITKVCEYDMLVKLNKAIQNDVACVIEALTGKYQKYKLDDKVYCRCFNITNGRQCEECIQKWLNEEE